MELEVPQLRSVIEPAKIFRPPSDAKNPYSAMASITSKVTTANRAAH
jgi:hypothetical protein